VLVATADSNGSSPRHREMIMLIKFFKDETGLELSEYAVVAALIVAATVAAFSLLNNVIATRIETLASFIQ
jgi:Flp pilus assembly pilin Flp